MSEFSPRPWLRNRHLQSIYPSFPLRRSAVERRALPLLASSVETILDCGDGVRLMGLHSAQTRRGRAPARQLVVLHHGWEGSADSLYIVGLGQYLFERGYDVFRLNLRDHGPTHHLNRELFHSCRLPEAVGAVKRLQTLFADQELNLVGFSLGGNFALRIGARAASAGLRLRRIVAVSPVLEPEVTLASLENGVALYRHYFVWKWRRSLLKKQLAWPDHYDFDEMLRTPTLTFMTDYLVRKYSDFPDLRSYLHGYAITRGALDSLEVPARIIAADDDPMIPASDLARLPRLPNLTVHQTRYGGHCGFVERLGGISWTAAQVLAELERDPQQA
jgi:predicted alpha/beta-fold hydrolase